MQYIRPDVSAAGKEPIVKTYFKAVTLGAFSFRDPVKALAFNTLIRKIPVGFSLLHLMLISFALNFPLMLSIARLPPYEVYTRLYGEQFTQLLQEETVFPEGLHVFDEALQEDFNRYMYESGYNKSIMLPLTGMAFFLLLIIQAAFYLMAAFFMRLHRMTGTSLSFSCRLSFLVFSSTLPVFCSALFGLLIPTVHIIVFYLAVIIISFHRSTLCHNG
jgi:hypothetical protein